jgi:hypothetical protein
MIKCHPCHGTGQLYRYTKGTIVCPYCKGVGKTKVPKNNKKK